MLAAESGGSMDVAFGALGVREAFSGNCVCSKLGNVCCQFGSRRALICVLYVAIGENAEQRWKVYLSFVGARAWSLDNEDGRWTEFVWIGQ